jgi:hypothetical protein
MKSLPRVCIVTTVRDPGPSFESFLRYHLSTGFERIFVFFDDPNDPAVAVAKAVNGVTSIPCDEAFQSRLPSLRLYEGHRATLHKEVMSRQILNAEVGIAMAREDGFDWIFHIDADEIIYGPGGTPINVVLNEIPADVHQVACFNHEAIAPSLDVENAFLEVSTFKRNEYFIEQLPGKCKKVLYELYPRVRPYFFAYRNGKAGARVSDQLVPLSVHRFSGAEEFDTFVMEGLVIYHYPCCGFDQYLQKYRVLGKFEDKWFGRDEIPLNFHLASRDAYQSGDYRRLKYLYKNYVMFQNPAAIAKLVKAGAFELNSNISRIMRAACAKRSRKAA